MSNLSDPSPHPRWCAVAESGNQEHASRRTEIRSLDGFESVSIQLRKSRHPAGLPYLLITSGGTRISMTLPQARALRHRIRSLVAWAVEQ